MTTTQHSPAPWSYEFSPYTVREAGDGGADAAGREIPAFEIFDADGTKVFDTNEDTPAGLQEANARLATAAPALLAALRAVLPYAQNESRSLAECVKRDGEPAAAIEATSCENAVELAFAAIAGATAASPPCTTDDLLIQAILARRRQIAVIWSVEDVQQVRAELTDAQAWEVLQATQQAHDATIGINWDVLASHAEAVAASEA